MSSAARKNRVIRAITLDLDDTLWPVGPTIVRAERLAHEWLAQHAPAVAAAWSVDRLRELRMTIMQSRADLRHDLAAVRRVALQTAFRETAESAEADATHPQYIEQALEVFMAARNQVDLYPEVAASLERLSQRYPIASLTNGNANLQRIGLDHLFQATVSAHAHGTSKPDPALFHIACRALDCAPEEVVHLGDDAELDVRGARGAGLHAVWINRSNLSWPGDDPPVMVADMLAFERWLETRSQA
jgi:FMN hydrolase / 5-amino-6-(5-phospho-D-ribitylamino)uracil phosphatase